ncbi:HU family DNA-binding protein [Riemerella anatipestifer]|uniref:HU family DNA-binding protein n=1 Tax=Riemerella anatipestifer TaxID=34085 RepID=UPI001C6EB02F|nr:HU family DNA-binding protein [Riemerella anatipestifer]QYR02527.1 HU family DNA-binding protein [Riemerella anatipestifer]
MAIKFTVVEKPQPGVAGGGIKKWYAQAVSAGELTIDDMVKQIEKFSALSEADIKGVLVALENVAQEALANGYMVRLEKLGTLYPTLSSGGAATEKDFNQSLIKSVGVNYRPGKRILDSMTAAGFEKMK